MTLSLEEKKQQASDKFYQTRKDICAMMEKIEQDYSQNSSQTNKDLHFNHTPWQRPYDNDAHKQLLGSGETGMMKGNFFEKIGINFSHVHGTFSEEFAKEIPGAIESDGNFWASGVSFVAHPFNPLVPAAHMNIRMIATSKSWFGGGGDLNPAIPNDDDTNAFHKALKQTCDDYDDDAYHKYKKWCDDYFYMPHRHKHRGVGGIFYDYLDSGDWQKDFDFTSAVALCFADIYRDIVHDNMHKKWTDDDKKQQLIYRGLYAEYNLIYDRGTRFGLMSGGNSEAILMSLPPVAHWD